jgi:hypothetical protein
MLAVNRWNETYERVLLGGLTCDGDDYYNSEQHMNAVYLPKYNKEKPLYIDWDVIKQKTKLHWWGHKNNPSL